MGVEGSGAVSGSEVRVKRVKKESIDVFRGWFVSELLCSSSFDWGLLDGMSSVSPFLYVLWRVLDINLQKPL